MSIQAELQRVFKNLGKSLDDGFNLHPDIFVGQADFDTSTTAANLYAYLGQLPGVREWLGDRVLHELSTRMIELPNKDWELSFKMKETEMEDALGTGDGRQLNQWAKMVRSAGEAYRIKRNAHYTDVLYGGLSETWSVDGQYFYDSDHPINPDEPAGSTFANRFDITGGDARPLTHANADYVYTKFTSISDEQGNPMVLGDVIAEVPRALETKARQIWEDAMIVPSVAVGANAASVLQSNPNKGRVKMVLVNPWLDAKSTTQWFMHCVGRAIKPYMWQDRKAMRQRQFDASNSEITANDGYYKFYTDARFACGRMLPQLTVTAGA